jgi:hypothetical protein
MESDDIHLNSVASSRVNVLPVSPNKDIDHMDKHELLALLKNNYNMNSDMEMQMSNSPPDLSGLTSKPGIFRYFTKDKKDNNESEASKIKTVETQVVVKELVTEPVKAPVKAPESPVAKEEPVKLGERISHIQDLISKPSIELLTSEQPPAQPNPQTLANESANSHSSATATELGTMHEVAFDDFATPDRVEIPVNLSNALNDLTHSVENIISNLDAQVDMNLVWQPLVEGMKQMSEKRERLIEIEKMFDQTVDEMDSLRARLCETLEGIKNSEIEIAKSLQARLQLANSLQEKLKAI